MRHLAAMATVREVGVDQFVHTKFSRELMGGPITEGIKFM